MIGVLWAVCHLFVWAATLVLVTVCGTVSARAQDRPPQSEQPALASPVPPSAVAPVASSTTSGGPLSRGASPGKRDFAAMGAHPTPGLATQDHNAYSQEDWLPKSRWAYLLFASGALTLFVISLTYLLLRLRARRAALVSFFTQDAIIERYLLMRGRRTPRTLDETEEAYRGRLRDANHASTMGRTKFRRLYCCRRSPAKTALTVFGVPLPVSAPHERAEQRIEQCGGCAPTLVTI